MPYLFTFFRDTDTSAEEMSTRFPKYPPGFGQPDIKSYGTTGLIFHDPTSPQTVIKWPINNRGAGGIMHEKEVYERLQELGGHDWLLTYYGGVEAHGLRLEYAPWRDLRSHIRKYGIGQRYEAMWMVQMAQVLEFVHSAGFCHGSMMLSHMMLDAPGNAKLADFAWCRPFGSGPLEAEVLASYEYPGNRLSVQGDLFALGSAMYELRTGLEPFIEYTDEEIGEKFRQGIFPDVLPLGDLGPIIYRCWTGSYQSATAPKEALEGKNCPQHAWQTHSLTTLCVFLWQTYGEASLGHELLVGCSVIGG